MKNRVLCIISWIGAILAIIGLLMTGICMFWKPIVALDAICVAFIGIFIFIISFLLDPETTIRGL